MTLTGTQDPVAHIVRRLGMTPHPEGGFFCETYRSPETLPAGYGSSQFDGPRSLNTAIYFLLRKGEKSHLHRIKSDEIWHYYEGGPLCIVELTPAGALTRALLGPLAHEGAAPQHLVRAGHWFGAFPVGEASYSLVGCTVAPGFDFADLTLADRGFALAQDPAHQEVLLFLTDGR